MVGLIGSLLYFIPSTLFFPIQTLESTIAENVMFTTNFHLFITLQFSLAGMILSIRWYHRKSLEESSDIKENALEAFTSPVIITDFKGKILYGNQSLLHFWGYRHPSQIIGKSVNDLFQGSLFTMKITEDMKKKGEWQSECTIKNGNDILHDIRAIATRISDAHGRSLGILISLTDITKQRQTEKQLREAHRILSTVNRELERKVEERTREVRRLVDQKNNFITQLSHDLKTPLTPIISLLPILNNSIKDTKEKKLLEVITRNVHVMRDLVSKTIDLVRLNSTLIEFQLESVNLKREIETVIDMNQHALNTHRITVKIDVDESVQVEADRLWLRQLLHHLLTNAIVYRCKDREGLVRIGAQGHEDMVMISIKDNGMGMSSSHLTHIFEEFYKADSARHQLESSGLGLSICRSIVQRHRGKIWAKSPGLGKGSTFFFTLKRMTSNNDKLEEDAHQKKRFQLTLLKAS
jgi:PAS domain S-box-containing protein